jgi:hypothetical protein
MVVARIGEYEVVDVEQKEIPDSDADSAYVILPMMDDHRATVLAMLWCNTSLGGIYQIPMGTIIN